MQSGVRPATIARREGLMLGVPLGILLALNFVLGAFANFSLFPIPTLVGVAAYFLAGMRASKVTGVVSTGLLAGLFTAVISSVINLVVALLIIVTNVEKLRIAQQKLIDHQVKGPHTPLTNSTFLQAEILTLVFEVIIAALFGIGLGAAGGAVGRARAPLPPQPYEESMYKGAQPPQQ